MSKDVVLVLAMILLDKVALNLVVPLIPFQLSRLGEDAFTVGLLMSTFALMQLLGGPVCTVSPLDATITVQFFVINLAVGWLSDKFGVARMLALSFVGSSVGHSKEHKSLN